MTTACSVTSLCLDANNFLTGDYAVGGAVFNGPFANGRQMGTINIPDSLQPNPVTVPTGAKIESARFIWGTVESTNAGAITGKVASFNGYNVTGTPVVNASQAPTPFNSGGCSGGAGGSKIMNVYEADVRPFLPMDANGTVVGNGTFTVGFASGGATLNQVPIPLGGFLVITYSVQSPLVPLNSIVIYDGAVAPNNTLSTLTQPMVGFYDAAASPVAKLTILAFSTQQNKNQVVTLNGTTLPSIYGVNTPPFPGLYGNNSDAPTWDGTNTPVINTIVHADDFTETVAVSPTKAGGGCPNYGAIIFSTTVADPNHDGLLKAWKTNVTNGAPNPGYTDAKFGGFVPLPGASQAEQDIFAEVDWLCNLASCDPNASGYLHSHLPKQQALDMVGDAFWKQNIHVHFDVGMNFNALCKQTPVLKMPLDQGTGCPDPYIIQGGTGGNAIPESAVLCTDATSPTPCPFPGTPAIGWKEGFLSVKNLPTQPNNTTVPLGNFYQTPILAGVPSPPPTQFGRKDSYHYVLFGHALGTPRSFWTAYAAILGNPSFTQLASIVNTGTAAVVTLQSPAGVVKPGDCSAANPPQPACSDANTDRITVGGALVSALNGTYKFATPPSSVTNGGVTTTTFTINTTNTTTTCPTAPCVPDGTYNYSTEPRLTVSYLGPTSTSGHSDFPGGADTTETFGLWPADDAPGCQPDPSIPLNLVLNPPQVYCVNQVGTIQAEAGTLLHELGHTVTLAHGGTFFPNGAVTSGALAGQQTNNPLGLRSYGLNCNPAYLSSMNYLFQVRGFPEFSADGISHPIDLSGQTLPSLSETALNETTGIGMDVFTGARAQHFTRWYAPPDALQIQAGQFAKLHCDGGPVGPNEPLAVRVNGSTFSAPIDWDNDNDPVPDPNPLNPVLWQDVNFNGSTLASPDPPAAPAFNNMQGFNDWVNIDLRKIGSRANAFGGSGGGQFEPGGGGTGLLEPGGGGGQFDPGGGGSGQFEPGGGGTGLLEPGGGGGQFDPGGGGGQFEPGGGGEQDEDTACSTADGPTGLTATLGKQSVDLKWNAPVGPCQVFEYDVWRATGPSFNTFTDVSGPIVRIKVGNGKTTAPPTMFTDTTVKNGVTYVYFVTSDNNQGARSDRSKTTPPITVVFNPK